MPIQTSPDHAAAPPITVRRKLQNLGWLLLCAASIYSFVRAHLLNTKQFLFLNAYLLGTERLPYQRRIFPLLFVKGLQHVPAFLWLENRVGHAIVGPGLLGFFLLDLIAYTVASIFCILLYRAATASGRSIFLVYPIFLFATVWTYVAPPDGNIYYPYDLASLAFFSAGLYFIYTRRFLLLLLTVLIGSFNRETTLFLIPLLALDRLTPPGKDPHASSRKFSERVASIPILQILALSVIWILVHFYLGHLYVHNNPVDQYLREFENLRFLSPHKWPLLLCACGFLLPVVLYFRQSIPDARIRTYLLIIPLWVLVMCCFGIIGEVRVFGELCPLVTVSCALLLDEFFTKAPNATRLEDSTLKRVGA